MRTIRFSKGKIMNSPILSEDKSPTETSESANTVSVLVKIDLGAFENGPLLEEMRKRGFYLSPYDLDDEDKQFFQDLAVRVLDILAKFEDRQINPASLAIEELVRDVVHRLKPQDPS